MPSNSLTCPKCYKKIPPEPDKPEKTETGKSGGSGSGGKTGGGSGGIALILALIPGLFGVLGLGILYKDHSSRSGLLFLVLGLLVFAVTILILTSSIPILNILFAIPFAIFYGLLYLGNVFITMAKSR